MSRPAFAFDKETSRRLSRLARKKGVSNTTVIRRAIALYELIERERAPESNLDFVNKDGQRVIVELP